MSKKQINNDLTNNDWEKLQSKIAKDIGVFLSEKQAKYIQSLLQQQKAELIEEAHQVIGNEEENSTRVQGGFYEKFKEEMPQFTASDNVVKVIGELLRAARRAEMKVMDRQQTAIEKLREKE